MTLAEAKIQLVSVGCSSDEMFRSAIEALPDRSRLEQLDPLLRALIETRLYQLVPVGVVS